MPKSKKSHTKKPSFDYLIGIGENIRAGSNIRKSSDFLNNLTKEVALVCGNLYLSGDFEKIIFSSGHTSGLDIPSEAQAMKSYMLSKIPNIAPVDILLEDKSLDTPTNALEISKLIKEKSARIAVVAPMLHKKRVLELLKTFNVNTQKFYDTDTYYPMYYPEAKEQVEKSRKSIPIKIELIKEAILNYELKFDQKGKIPTFITHILRK